MGSERVMDAMELPPGRGQVASQIRWLVLSRTLDVIGEVHPQRPTSITNDTTANIPRSLRGLTLRQNDMRQINPNVDRIMPVWEFEDGSHAPGFTGWPCGVFMFGSRIRDRGSLHTMFDMTLMDQSYQLDQEMSKSFGVSSQELIVPRIEELMNYGGIVHFEIDPSEQKVKDPVNWPVGTRLLQIIRDMCVLCGFHKPWFSNPGIGQVRAPVELSAENAYVYDLDTDSGRVRKGTIQENDNLLDAPNVYVVSSNGPTQVEITARSYIDARLPHSYENIGYERPKVIRMQGLVDTGQAQRIADTYAAADTNQYLTVEFGSAANPKHDTYDAVKYDGILFNELRWSQTLTPGGVMTHSCTRGPYDQEPTF